MVFIIMIIVTGEQVPTNISRPCIAFISSSLKKLSNDQAKEVGLYAIEKLSPRYVSFEEEVHYLIINILWLIRIQVLRDKCLKFMQLKRIITMQLDY
jgi:hypothetical protein